ncbi:hypothetical protein CDG76_11070 [Nostoc sp. 'Peltigera membranacea cyanobiont' 210A]|uniref:hypothetical protein n=1 Tax=Nostoc sp. 'Peltigera membranacea cyanobiont' 210A TaxID=2014529 RepID=UPI000B958CBA|nr:hypothetical protein [Nostoc sp. 'Peltigera membranacea cyanobiont' 210A]OYD95487.1 hypothetical protein CDG76_11070 [Nostoc sp. 'Peltigera membranacea cyanobiont' 210A]
MVTVTLTAVATAIATTLWTKAQEKIGENLGDATWTLGGKLIGLLHQKNKSPLLTNAVEGSEPQRLDYGQAVLELKAAADADPEIAQAVVEVETAVNNDQSETAKEIKKLVEQINSHPSVVNNAKLANEIKNLFQGNQFNAPVTFS